jgi:hypothetical protein
MAAVRAEFGQISATTEREVFMRACVEHANERLKGHVPRVVANAASR